MTEDRNPQIIEFDDFFIITRKFYDFVGMTLHEFRSHRTTLGSLLFWSTILSINWALALEVINIFDASFMDSSAVLTNFTFTFLAQLKVYIIWSNRANVMNLFQLMKEHFPRTAKDQAAFNVSDALRNILHLQKLYITVLISGVWSFNLLPFAWSIVEYLLDSNDGFFIFRFPYYTYFPVEINNNWIYSVSYIQQMHAGVSAVNCCIASDTLLYGIISVLLMNFRYMQEQLKRMDVKGTQDDLDQLKVIINFHRITLNMAEMTNQIFSLTLLLSFLSSALIICLAAFQTTAPDVSLLLLAEYFMFLMHELVQTTGICYLGQSLMDGVNICLKTSIQLIFCDMFLAEFGGLTSHLCSRVVQG